MTVALKAEEIQKLIGIMASFDEWRTEERRVAFIIDTLAGSPRAQDIMGQLDLGGTPRRAAIRVVDRLSSFGRVTPDKEALGVFINKMIDYRAGSSEDVAFMRSLLDRYDMDKPVVASPAFDDWRDGRTEDLVQEKIFGENTLRDVRVLQLALKAAESVVHITMPDGYGSGFIVGDNLCMTNHHVIAGKPMAAKSDYTFRYQLAVSNLPDKADTVHMKLGGEFYTNPELDYTVVELERTGQHARPLLLQPVRPPRGSRVSIIQHPGGHYKKISMQNNFVAYADARVIQYTTSTMPGSSGSPVFDDEFNVVAIHHSGGRLEEPDSGRWYRRNEGISMIAVLEDLRESRRDILARIESVS